MVYVNVYKNEMMDRGLPRLCNPIFFAAFGIVILALWRTENKKKADDTKVRIVFDNCPDMITSFLQQT